MKGVYVLIIEKSIGEELEIGKLGTIEFKSGFYAYVGSALSGLEQRIKRHLRREKRLYWHIDYLLASPGADVREVIFKETSNREECMIARKMHEQLEHINGFGCSDCRCESHLFFCNSHDRLLEIAYHSLIATDTVQYRTVEGEVEVGVGEKRKVQQLHYINCPGAKNSQKG